MVVAIDVERDLLRSFLEQHRTGKASGRYHDVHWQGAHQHIQEGQSENSREH